MIKTISKCLAIGLTLAFALWLVGCGSSSGGGGAVADGGTVTRVANTYDEQCALCHGPGRVADVVDVHDPTSNSPVVSIIAVREIDLGGGDLRLEVDFKIVESTNPLIPIFIDETDPSDYRNVRFTLAKLMPPPGAGDSSFWQSYINENETKDVGDPGTTPDPTTTVQATYERANAAGGVFSALATPGQYRYRLSFNMNGGKGPIPVTYDVANTHRIAIQFPDNVDNATVEFEPNALPVTAPFPAVTTSRRIAVVANCNECHVRLGLHGGDRVNLDYCVNCHNPGSTDANSGNVVDFKVMIHKIHHGAELPSVEAGGQYTIWGYNNSEHDYSTVEFPQDIRNCTKCHRNASESDNWKNVPNIEACGSCHDDVNFATGLNHIGGARTNPECAGCHPPSGTVQAVTEVHVIQEQVAAAQFQYNIISVSNAAPGVPGQFMVGPGEFPVVRFSVTDPTSGDAPYDILNDPEFTAGGGVSRLAILIGWFGSLDYTNTGSTVTPGLPISINPLAGAVDNLDGTFTVASTVPIPAGVTGSGVVAIEGHPAAESVPGSGTYDLRVPVTGVVQAVAITDPAPQSRRVVVDALNNCNNCHGLLSLHGNNRNNNTQLCVICHNANATDINRRPADPTTTTDGKVEEAIDFKYMIHSIHAGAAAEHGFRTEGIVVYGYGGTEHDFSHVRLPGEELNLLNCEGCHNSGTNELPIDPNALPTTTSTEADIADPDDDVNITPTASVCSSCHDGISPAKTHMADNGGLFDFRAFTTTTSGGGGGGGDQAALCGPGPVSAQPAGHSTRTDCCSCHGPN
ncbi:MAG: OmcA/MtrC family decaheme c-type cytochrome [Desulfobacteraceae bacterium]|jgi:OmcA/MtrC family decaheme c-type cytochrome